MRYDTKPNEWRKEGIELLPADPEGWWCMARGSMTSREWAIGDTPQEALAKFMEENNFDDERGE